MANNPLRLVPLGGLGEVGKNMMAIEYGENIMIVDTGIMFPENDMLGIDYIIPDFSYLEDKKDIVRGIVITHGHEDHTGAIAHVARDFNVPIYATRLTMGLIEVKLKRAGMAKGADLNVVEAGDRIPIGPFRVEFFHVAHSIPDAVGLGIESPAGLIVMTGDYKFDQTPVDGWPTDFGVLGAFSSRGVLALLADSTNSDKPGWTPSETVIEPAFDKVFREAKGRILIGSFASLISRMQQVANAAERHGRKMAFVGMSMVDNSKMARDLGYLKVSDELIVDLNRALSMDPSEVVLMCTGTQGEPSSVLARLSTGSNRQFDIEPGDTVVLSSHPIPGNEEMVYRIINRLFQRGAEVIYDPIAPVHVSGHASAEEMKLMIQMVKPKYLVPVHGELRMLKQHAELAKEIGFPEDRIAVVENGQVIEFKDGEMTIGERVPGGYVFVDGSGIGDVGPMVIREREALARDGFVTVQLHLDPSNGGLQEDPVIHSKGFVFIHESKDLLEEAKQIIWETAKSSENGNINQRVESELRRFFHAKTGRRPMIIVMSAIDD
ncbi:MAG: ribonuclease J [Anaerolineales bacterium]